MVDFPASHVWGHRRVTIKMTVEPSKITWLVAY
jgi:hypothetical protein